MTAASFHRPTTAAVPEHAPVLSVSVVPGETVADVTASSALASDPASASVATAERAVEAVLTAAERVSSGERQLVNLQFSVNGTALNVRVELRADEVHATFHTDSPELRTALAHEWQAVHGTAADSDRSFRLAPPTFASASAGNDSAPHSSFTGGEGSARHREPSDRRTPAEAFELAASVRASVSESSDTPAASHSAPRSPSLPAARRLSTHA